MRVRERVGRRERERRERERGDSLRAKERRETGQCGRKRRGKM
jgi:hypothetical protein